MAEKKSNAGRKPHNKSAVSVGPDLDTQASEQGAAELAESHQVLSKHEQHLVTIDQTFGENLPYDKARIESETMFYLKQSAESMLHVGMRLLVIKEHEKHGHFTESLERVGIAPQTARKFMQAAVKYSGSKRSLTSVLGKTKLLELISEDDEDLEALAEGGTLAGLSLDEIDVMSASALRATLRKERAKRVKEETATEKLLSKKDEKINQYEREASRVLEWPDVVQSINMDITLATGKCVEQISALRKLVDTVLIEGEEHKLTDGQIAAIAEPFNALQESLSEHFSALQSEYHESLSGYLDTPPETWAKTDQAD